MEEATKLIEKIAAMSTEEKKRLEISNKKIFEECFTIDKYVDKYLKFLNSI